jgi:hypothetical protein
VKSRWAMTSGACGGRMWLSTAFRAQVDADAIERREVRSRGVQQAAVEQDHRARRTVRRDDAAAHRGGPRRRSAIAAALSNQSA